MKSKNRFLILALVIVGIIFISGCVEPTGPGAPTTAPGAAGAPNETQKKLTTAITPARDMTGEWEGLPGSAKWRDNVLNWACSYEGYIHLSLNQNGNNLVGTFQATITKVIPNTWNTGKVPCSQTGKQTKSSLTGTVSSSSFNFNVASIAFTGTFTTDVMQGTFESCPNQICSDGTHATGTNGDFKATRQS